MSHFENQLRRLWRNDSLFDAPWERIQPRAGRNDFRGERFANHRAVKRLQRCVHRSRCYRSDSRGLHRGRADIVETTLSIQRVSLADMG